MDLLDVFVKIGLKDEATGKLGKVTSTLGKGLKTAANVGIKAVGAASTAIAGLIGDSISKFSEYEQLSGGVKKIFGDMDTSKIFADANEAYLNLNMSASDYLAVINDVGAAFASTMGAEAGYETAKIGLQAIADYASGTGKDVDTLSEKFAMITRSTSSYQSIADQFSGILPATSAGFLEQAQAAGFLSEEYTSLTQVPIDEYQQAVALMLEQGTANLGLAGNTAAETTNTISGSIAAAEAAWANWVTSLSDSNADVDATTQTLLNSVITAADNILPTIETAISTVISTVTENAPEIISTLLGFITENLPELVTAGVGLLTALLEGVVEALPDIAAAALQIVTSIGTELAGLAENLKGYGAQVIADLKAGVAQAWEGVKTWFSGLWDGLFGNKKVSVTAETGSTDGSHAAGLSYVPYDNYVATLHRGETVMTAREAREWRQSQASGAAAQNVTTNVTLELDGAVLARKLFRHNQTAVSDHGAAFVRG